MNNRKMQPGKYQNPHSSDNVLDESKKERKVGGEIRQGGTFFSVIKKSVLTTDNTVREEVTEELKYFACGCPCMSFELMGKRCDICEKVNCREHSYRCVRCKQSICVRCAKHDRGYMLCARCFWVLFFTPWLKRKYFL